MNKVGCSSNRPCQQGLGKALTPGSRCLPGRLGAGRETASSRSTRQPSWSNRRHRLEAGGKSPPNGWNCWPRSMGGNPGRNRGRPPDADQRAELCWSGWLCWIAGGLSFWRCPAKLAAHPERTVSCPLRGAFSGRESLCRGGWAGREARRRRESFWLLRLSPAPVPCRKGCWAQPRELLETDLADIRLLPESRPNSRMLFVEAVVRTNWWITLSACSLKAQF